MKEVALLFPPDLASHRNNKQRGLTISSHPINQFLPLPLSGKSDQCVRLLSPHKHIITPGPGDRQGTATEALWMAQASFPGNTTTHNDHPCWNLERVHEPVNGCCHFICKISFFFFFNHTLCVNWIKGEIRRDSVDSPVLQGHWMLSIEKRSETLMQYRLNNELITNVNWMRHTVAKSSWN